MIQSISMCMNGKVLIYTPLGWYQHAQMTGEVEDLLGSEALLTRLKLAM